MRTEVLKSAGPEAGLPGGNSSSAACWLVDLESGSVL